MLSFNSSIILFAFVSSYENYYVFVTFNVSRFFYNNKISCFAYCNSAVFLSNDVVFSFNSYVN